MSAEIAKLLQVYGHKKAVFLDIGANLGSYSLYMAQLGFHSWALEALEINHEQVGKSY